MKTTYQQQIPGAGKVGTVGLQVLGNELDLLGWYEDFEDQLQDSGNDEYKYGIFYTTQPQLTWLFN